MAPLVHKISYNIKQKSLTDMNHIPVSDVDIWIYVAFTLQKLIPTNILNSLLQTALNDS